MSALDNQVPATGENDAYRPLTALPKRQENRSSQLIADLQLTEIHRQQTAPDRGVAEQPVWPECHLPDIGRHRQSCEDDLALCAESGTEASFPAGRKLDHEREVLDMLVSAAATAGGGATDRSPALSRQPTARQRQAEALALSDRISVLSHGRIEQVGSHAEIYERPATAFVAEFFDSSNYAVGPDCRKGRGRYDRRNRNGVTHATRCQLYRMPSIPA